MDPISSSLYQSDTVCYTSAQMNAQITWTASCSSFYSIHLNENEKQLPVEVMEKLGS